MSSIALSAKRNCDYDRWQDGWNGFDNQNRYDITTGYNDAFRAALYRASLNVSSQQKLTECSVKVNLLNDTLTGEATATVYCYLYTSDPSAASYNVDSVPSGYIKVTSSAVNLGADAGKYQTFSFTGLNITSASNLYFLFTTDRGEDYWLIYLYNWNNGTAGFGTPTVTGTFASTDTTAPTVSFTVSGIGLNGFTINASANANCNLWQYKLGSGNWVNFSTTNGTSASKAITGLSQGTSYSVQVRARKTVNNLYGTASARTVTTLARTLTVSPTTVTAGGKVTLSVSNSSGVSYTATIKSGSTTLATQSFTGSVQITCPQSWFVTAGKASSSSMTLSVTVTGGGQTLTGSFTLNAQALSLSVSPASVATGGSVTLTVTNGSGYSLTATIKYGNTTLKTQAFTTGTCTITCPKSWFTTAGVSTSKSMSLSVSVTGGPSTLTGSFTLTAGDDMKPSFGTPTASVVDLTGNFPSTYIAGYSKVKVAASVSTGSNAGISTVKLSYPGGTTVNMSLNSSTGKYEATTASPITANTTFTVTVTDVRGMSNSSTVSVTGVVPYTAPSITIDTGLTYRCNSSGTKTSGGTYYRAKATANYHSFSGNSLVKFTVKIKNSATETNLTSGVQSGAISGMTNPLIRYIIVFTVQDKVSAAVTREYTLEGMLRNIVVKRSSEGTYVGVGITPTRTSGASDIELPHGGNLSINGKLAFVQPGEFEQTCPAFGYVANSGKLIRLFFLPPQDLIPTNTLSVSVIKNINFGTSDGITFGNATTDLSEYITNGSRYGAMIRVDITNSSGWGLTNNSIVAGLATIKYTIT